MTEATYTTQLQAGLGLVPETRTLLELWEPGMEPQQLLQLALQSGQFPNVTARRLRNVVVEGFKPRYLAPGSEVTKNLKRLQPVFSTSQFNQLMFLYTCRANAILADFVRDIYWERYSGGYDQVSKQDAKDFINRAVDDGKTIKRWSDSTITRVSNYLTGACADYGLLGQRSQLGRKISPFFIDYTTSVYLAYDLHFSGLGDNALLAHPDWQLFGLQRDDVREELKRISLKGYLIFQAAGDVTHIGWIHKTMKELVDVLAQG